MKLLPIIVIVLPKYPETGNSDPYVAPPTTVSGVPDVEAVAPDPPPLNTTLTPAAPTPVPLPTTTCIWLLDTTLQDDAGVEPTVTEQLCPCPVVRKFTPVNVIVLRLYAADGATPLTNGLSLTLSELPEVSANTDTGFDITTRTPAAP